MSPYARQDGYATITRTGAGINWLRNQRILCANRVVLMFGTNDMLNIRTDSDALEYSRSIRQIISTWNAQEVIWATPGCFYTRQNLERASILLHKFLENFNIHSGREYRCRYSTRDGVHPNQYTYREWWSRLSQ